MFVSLSDVGRFLDRYRDNPVGFVREILGANPTPYQQEWLRLYAGNPRVGIRACRGAGKTAASTWMILHFLMTRPLSRVIATGPTFEKNIVEMLWPEFRAWVSRSPVASEWLTMEAHHIRINHPEYARRWYAVGTSSDKPGNMEGFHAPHMMYLVDEAKTVQREIFTAIIGSLTEVKGEQRMLLISTPDVVPRGYFYDVFGRLRDRWATAYIDAFTAIKQGGRVSADWVEDMRANVGEDSPEWVAHVLGEFPDQGGGSLIPTSWVEAAVRRHPLYRGALKESDRTLWPEEPVEMGVDVADGGADKTIATIRQGPVQWAQHRIPAGRSTVAAGRIKVIRDEWNRTHQDGDPDIVGPVERIKIERTGPGAGVGDLIPGTRWFVPGARPRDRERFQNARAEQWWLLRRLFETGEIAILDDSELIADLKAIPYDYTDRARIKIGLKDNIRKELGRSPDKGDALMIAYCQPPASGGSDEVPV